MESMMMKRTAILRLPINHHHHQYQACSSVDPPDQDSGDCGAVSILDDEAV